MDVTIETEGGGLVRRELHALVGRELAPAVDGFAEQGAQFGGIGRSLAAEGHLRVAGDQDAQLVAVGGEVRDVGLGGFDVIFVKGDERLARSEGMSAEETRFESDVALQHRGGRLAAAVSEISHDQSGHESRAEDDESEVEAEVFLETMHGLRGPCPFG